MKNILIVDDSDLIRDALKLFLDAAGFRVTAAADAEEAEELLREREFDLGIFDVNMPGKNGIELTRTALSRPEAGGMRVIILSSETDGKLISGAVDAGAIAWVDKPFRRDHLLGVIEMLQEDS